MIMMLDTNILIYHFVQNHEQHSAAATSLMKRIELGEQNVYCPSTAILEATYVLDKSFGADRATTARLLTGFLLLPGVQSEYKNALIRSLVFWQSNPGLDFADCYHLALTKELGFTQIYSFDKKMDRYPGVERIEPGSVAEEN